MELVLASTNMHKVREIRDMLRGVEHIDVISLLNFPKYEAPEETGITFKDNAELKAQHAAKKLEKWVIADDSGLVVPALGGKPGVYSRRYAGEDATDRENNLKLLKAMEGLEGIERSAYYECVISVASPQGVQKTVSGICEGYILQTGRGSNGFGYDSLFMKHDYDKTFGELDESTKNRVSHRRKAIDKIIPFLESLKKLS